MLSDTVEIDYTNYEGKRSIRRISPIEIEFTSNKWHEKQWLLRAWDCDKQAERQFAMKDIHSWRAL